NRIFNDSHVNLFSEREVTQWAFNWGQFLDHTFGLREAGGENAAIAFDPFDPLEEFQNDAGEIGFQRSAAAAGTGDFSAREQNNVVSSYIDGWAIYGGTEERLEWLREGPVDGDLSNNSAKLLLVNGFLPRANTRGDVSAAPVMDLPGALRGTPEKAFIAGDVRANENIALTATHTLFAREHNRIVNALPTYLDEETKFQIARKVVGAKQQYITYEAYLPSLGLKLDSYQGYNPNVDPRVTNEFATVGYRAHSMIHGDFDIALEKKDLSKDQLKGLEAKGVLIDGDDIEVPLNIAFGNPDLVTDIGLEGILAGLEAVQYNNDEQIDNQLRSILFQIPRNIDGPLDGQGIENNFTVVSDIGAIDVERGRDHGIASYNDLREAFGLARVRSFTEITGESTAQLPYGLDIDDPEILLFDKILDENGKVEEEGADKILKELAKGEEVEGIFGVRRSTLASRLNAIYGDVDQVDAFVGLVSEKHLPGSEFGELQQAIWKEQFEDLRDGDRFFYANDPALQEIEARYGISYKTTLADIITQNTALSSDDLEKNVFIANDDFVL
ncbi:MAG: peroxidase family protein, partial [Thermosynechococcaceae cyanobacterium]